MAAHCITASCGTAVSCHKTAKTTRSSWHSYTCSTVLLLVLVALLLLLLLLPLDLQPAHLVQW
jgi:protein-S-isoprenylcysteine O-methyltransferase Ste14